MPSEMIISARNYANKCAEDLARAAFSIKKVGLSDFQETLKKDISLIRKSVNFSLPDEPLPFDYEDVIKHKMNIPFPQMTIEYKSADGGVLLLCNTTAPTEGLIERYPLADSCIRVKLNISDGVTFIPSGYEMLFPCLDGFIIDLSNVIVANSEPLYTRMFDINEEGAHRSMQVNHVYIVGMLVALSMSNITIGNRRDYDTGYIPMKDRKIINTSKVLVINSGKDNGQLFTGYSGGGRNGPRQHLRRGHARHYTDGKSIWINPCMVAASDRGKIDKNYLVI